MDDVALGLNLARTVQEYLGRELEPISKKLTRLTLELAKLGNVKVLQQKVDAQQQLIDAQAQRIKRLEELGRELEIHLAQSAGIVVGTSSTAVQ